MGSRYLCPHVLNQDYLIMKGLRAFSAGFDLRVIYRENANFITMVLLEPGTRNQVY
jgi:hypothetical protein